MEREEDDPRNEKKRIRGERAMAELRSTEPFSVA